MWDFTMAVALQMSLPSRLLSSLVSTLIPSRVPIQSQVQSRTQPGVLLIQAEILPPLTLQPAQSATQGTSALLPPLFAVLLVSKNVDHVLGKKVPKPQ